jgi:hypothetical protein
MGRCGGILTIAPVLLMIGYRLQKSKERVLPALTSTGAMPHGAPQHWKLEDQGVTAAT